MKMKRIKGFLLSCFLLECLVTLRIENDLLVAQMREGIFRRSKLSASNSFGHQENMASLNLLGLLSLALGHQGKMRRLVRQGQNSGFYRL